MKVDQATDVGDPGTALPALAVVTHARRVDTRRHVAQRFLRTWRCS